MSPQTMEHEHSDEERTPPQPPRWWRTPVSRVPREQDQGLHVAGVVAGVSRAYGFDVRTTRVAVAIGTLVLPVLALVYLAAWVLLPDTPDAAVPLEDVVRDRARLPVVVAMGLVILAGGLGSFGAWFLLRGAPWGLVLIAIGVLLWVAGSSGSTGTGVTTPPPGSGPPLAPPRPGATVSTSTPSAAPLQSVAVPTPTAHRPTRRPIGSVSFLLAVMWVGVAVLLEASGAWAAPALWVIATALCIVAVGLARSAIVNRNWLVLLPFGLVASTILALGIAQPDFDGGTGRRTVTPTTVAAAEQRQHLAAGELEIDLTSLAAPAADATVVVTAEVGTGRLHVLVPDDAAVVLSAEVGMGVVQLDGRDLVEGVRQDVHRTVEPLDPPATGEPRRTFVLDVRAGMGQVDVEHAA